MTRLQSVCPECGAVFERQTSAAYCETCRPPDTRPRTAAKREANKGYGARWNRLSKRARKLQPFCSDCGTMDDLTADHTEEAWKRGKAGKLIRLQDIDVVCRSCNSSRGPARGDKVNQRRKIVDAELQRRRERLTDSGDDSDLFLDD